MIKWLISLPIDDLFYGTNINPIYPKCPMDVFALSLHP